MSNPILEQTDGSEGVQFSTLWKGMAAASFMMLSSIFAGLLTWGVWITVTVNGHSEQIARLDERSNNHAGATAESELSAKTWLTTQEVAKREKVTDRTVLNYIEAGMIDPQPLKQGKSWVIAEHYRIVPNDAENCGTQGGDE